MLTPCSKNAALSPCEDGQLIVRRIIKASGSSQNLINDSPVTLQVLKRIGELLVDMHGPHDHQSLLSPEFQVDLLDAFGHLWDERAAYEDVFRQIQALEEKRAALAGMGESVAEQIDLLTYRVKEIEEAAPVEGEEEKVQQEHLMVGNAQRILELGGGVLNALSEGEGSAFDALAGAQKNLEELARLVPEAKAWQEEARGAAVRIQELCAAIHGLADRVEADPARLDWLDQRLATYQRLRKKYAPTVPEILEILKQSKERLHALADAGRTAGGARRGNRKGETGFDPARNGAAQEAAGPWRRSWRRRSRANCARWASATGRSPWTCGTPSRDCPGWTMSSSGSRRTWASRCARCGRSRPAAKSRASCWRRKSCWRRTTGFR